MRFVKTEKSKRKTYIYTFGNGDAVEIKVGDRLNAEDPPVTRKMIELLHRLDDLEVESNLRACCVQDD